MKGLKIDLRNKVLKRKESFINSRIDIHLIDAAIIRGIYYGIGGTKAIPLPSFCNTLTNVVGYVTKAKIKFTGDIFKDIKKLASVLLENLRDILDIQISHEGVNSMILSIYGARGCKLVNVGYGGNLSNNDLANIAVSMLEIVGDHTPRIIEKNLGYIKESIKKWLNYIDRRW